MLRGDLPHRFAPRVRRCRTVALDPIRTLASGSYRERIFLHVNRTLVMSCRTGYYCKSIRCSNMHLDKGLRSNGARELYIRAGTFRRKSGCESPVVPSLSARRSARSTAWPTQTEPALSAPRLPWQRILCLLAVHCNADLIVVVAGVGLY